MKLLAPSVIGSEFVYDRNRAMQCSDAGAVHIAAMLNAHRYKIAENERYFIHDCSAYELEYTAAGYTKAYLNRGRVYVKCF